MSFTQKLRKWLIPEAYPGLRIARVPAGMYHFERDRDGQLLRFHLRVGQDGGSLLVACAAEAVLLSPLATRAAWSLLSREAPEKTPSDMPQEVTQTVEKLLKEIGTPGARYPILQLEDPAIGKRCGFIRPVQADVVIHESSNVLKTLDELWKAQIPTVRLRPKVAPKTDSKADQFNRPFSKEFADQLVRAVEHAEDLGMISGLRASATALASGDLLNRLAAVGLDYVVLPWGVSGEVHQTMNQESIEVLKQAVQQVRACEITTVLEADLVEQNIDALEEHLPHWVGLGVSQFEVFALAKTQQKAISEAPASTPSGQLSAIPAQALRQIASLVDDLSGEHEVAMCWLPSREITDHGLVSLSNEGPRAAGELSIRVEQDGAVVPAYGPAARAGNLHSQPWSQIWEHPAFERLRLRQRDHQPCEQCPRLDICSFGCPADLSTWETEEGDSSNRQDEERS